MDGGCVGFEIKSHNNGESVNQRELIEAKQKLGHKITFVVLNLPRASSHLGPGAKVPKNQFVKFGLVYSVKLVFSYVVKGIKIKITAKFRVSRRLRCEDTKRLMSSKMRPRSFGTFENGPQDCN